MSNLVEGYPVRRNYAWEFIEGQRVFYDVVGTDSLPDGWPAPDFTPMTWVDPLDTKTGLSVTLENFRYRGRSLFYVVNGLATPECQKGAKKCQALSRVPAPGVHLFIVSNEDPADLLRLAKEQGLTIPMLSTAATTDHPESNFGLQYGLYLRNPQDPSADGMLMRSLIGLRGAQSLKQTDPLPLLFRKRITNQGGPQPNFIRGVEIARAA